MFPENGTKLEDTRVTLRGDDDDNDLKPVCRDHGKLFNWQVVSWIVQDIYQNSCKCETVRCYNQL